MALNEQQERFCQSYVLHRNASEAARAAGYSKDHAARQGHRLLQSEEVLERINELEQNLTTDVDVISEIEKQYEYANANGHTNSAIKALELLSKIMGKDFYIKIGQQAGFLDSHNKVDNVDNEENKHQN
jgi:phage terminase small subunit